MSTQTPMKPEGDSSTPPKASDYRIDVKLHEVLMDEAGPNRPNAKTVGLKGPVPESEGEGFPEPVHPQKTYSEETDASLFLVNEYARGAGRLEVTGQESDARSPAQRAVSKAIHATAGAGHAAGGLNRRPGSDSGH